MNKYILHGGFDKNKEYLRDEFFQEALRDTPTDVKIFFVFFAELEEYLQLRIEQCKGQFNKNKDSKNLEFKKKTKEISEGLGILPFKIIVHYTDDMGNPLSEIEPNLKTIFLKEYETKVLYI